MHFKPTFFVLHHYLISILTHDLPIHCTVTGYPLFLLIVCCVLSSCCRYKLVPHLVEKKYLHSLDGH